MGWIFTGIFLVSLLFFVITRQAPSAALAQGVQAGVELALSLCGSLCLWSGVGALADRLGLTDALGRLLRPVLKRLFPSSEVDTALRRALSGNISANLLGLGNAATPMGIEAAKRLRDPQRPQRANGQLCRLIVLNTASIQLIPANVAALRAGLGSHAPFDILPAVWVTSLVAAAVGLTAAFALEGLCRE